MSEVPVYNFKTGEKIDTVNLPDNIFNYPLNQDLIHQVLYVQSLRRKPTLAHTKNRGEVRGGGRKPWRQKGTGRARHGSIRSPLWRGGGVVFGPRKERNYKKNIPIKMRRKALFSVLSQKNRDKELIIFDKIDIDEPKTKILAQNLKILRDKIQDFKKGSMNIVLPSKNKNIFLAAKNLPKVNTILAKDLNVFDLLNFKYVLIDVPGVEVIKETFKT